MKKTGYRKIVGKKMYVMKKNLLVDDSAFDRIDGDE
jgi:hypothetical protein